MDRLRIDKWLWFVRIAKTRSIAQKMIEDGVIFVNGTKVLRPSETIRQGDLILFPQGRSERLARIEKLEEKRVAAPLARQCYAFVAPEEWCDSALKAKSEQSALL